MMMSGMISTPGAIPAMPISLSVCAAMMPATIVPWSLVISMSALSVTKFHPWVSSTYQLLSSSLELLGISDWLVRSLSSRSGWLWWRPLSMTATSTHSPPDDLRSGLSSRSCGSLIVRRCSWSGAYESSLICPCMTNSLTSEVLPSLFWTISPSSVRSVSGVIKVISVLDRETISAVVSPIHILPH